MFPCSVGRLPKSDTLEACLPGFSVKIIATTNPPFSFWLDSKLGFKINSANPANVPTSRAPVGWALPTTSPNSYTIGGQCPPYEIAMSRHSYDRHRR